MKNIQIAIDGPAGSGKSTIAKLVAKAFEYTHIDTGAMYRAITLKAMRLNIDLSNEDAFDFIDQTRFDYKDGILYMDDEDVSKEIRTREVSNNVSLVSSHFIVRDKTVKRQQEISKNLNVVMDGRDIGYNVLPNADFKFYLTANVETRARRRYKENLERGIHSTLKELQTEISSRDAFDSSRVHSPLKPADDAIIIDTSDMSIEEVIETIKVKVREDDSHGI
ncbi:MAG: (d)CMP kinase [Candidatus Izemoplasmataceae bacterium]|jgi:CMP/dCMP kinase